ncbi:OmpA family protein [Rudanella paleaurantiibacter]|uniref:OmpA family protein n=1 Tax=Rudanella paleaurantiibacter TaxID=2614655 RepID=A0A7J5TWQ2_9BACT|nr:MULTISPECIES: OmpA family protein [Rudanella]KAB7729055.1 OmpA family protein [Rudanella paleaurantiibacter]
MKQAIYVLVAMSLLSSCVSKKKLTQLQSSYNELENARNKAVADLSDCDRKLTGLQSDLRTRDTDLATNKTRIAELESQLADLRKNNNSLIDRMADLSVVSKQGAESIKKSLEVLNEQTKQVNNLNQSIQRKDSLNLALVMSLKRSLADVNDQDIQVEVKKGVVYVSIADKLLFASGRYEVNKAAEAVLGKVASVVNDHKELDVLVQGHTDVVPIAGEFVKDNWDLSVMRATSVVRLLQSKFSVAPERLTAGGRGEYEPKDDNATATGRKTNRRTEIILTPKLDQFFNLLTAGQGK